MTETQRDGRLILTWPWSTSWLARLFAGFVGLICVGQLLLALVQLLDDPLYGLQMLGGFAIMGPFFAFVYAMVFNQTELTAGDGYLTVRHFPLWWGRPRRFEGVQALRIESYRNKRLFYRIHARVAEGHEVMLASGLEQDQAQQLCERLRPACSAL